MNNNDDWLNNLASSLGLDSSTSSDHNAISTSYDANTSYEHNLSSVHNDPFQLSHTLHEPSHIDPHAWHQTTMRLNDSDSYISTSTSLSDLTAEISPGISSLSPHQHFDPHHIHGMVIGNPMEEMNYWHQQISADACGIATQQNAIEHLTHQPFSQEQLIHDAQEHHWYSQNIGTSAEDFGKLITEHTHVPVENHYHGTIGEIADKLHHGEEVFVGVNSTIEWLPDHNSILGQTAPDLFDPHHYQGAEANHIVQVIGLEIDPHNPHNSYVVVNDSLSPDGRGVEIPVEQFQESMKASDGYIASTEIHSHHVTGNDHHSIAFRGCDDYGFDENRKNFYVDGHIRGHCDGRKFYTRAYPTINSDTYKGCLGTDLNIYDANDVKVGYVDSCRNVHKNDGTIVIEGGKHSGFDNVGKYLLDILG